MYIVYNHPVDGFPRARRCDTYHEAAEVILALQEINADPIPVKLEDLFAAEPSILPLIVEQTDSEIEQQKSHPVEDDAITI
jgi:hypothetical protein